MYPANDGIGRCEAPRDEPPLQRQAANLPELSGNPLPIGMGRSAPPPWHGEHGVDVVVYELPADMVEEGDIMAMDDVDPLGPLFTDQIGPFVGALTAAHDEHYVPRGDLFEVHCVNGMRGHFGRN